MDGRKKSLERDRRSSCRHSLKTALRVRVWKSGMPEHRAESVNLSQRGIYFATKQSYCEGEIVEVLLKMPEEVSGEPTTEWRFTGHVVRVEPLLRPEGKVGVGVQFYYCEVSQREQAPLVVGDVTSWRMMSAAERRAGR
jgi:hypothetical protein